MSSIEAWARNVLKTVETDGPDHFVTIESVRFVTAHDYQVWETWWAPFPSPEDFAREVDERQRGFSEQWPTRKQNCILQAVSSKGEVMSQHPVVVIGKNKEGTLDGFQAAQAAAMDGVATTIEKLHSLTNTQLDQARMVIELQNETIRQQVQLLTLYRHKEAAGAPEEPGPLTKIAAEHGGEILGMVQALIDHNVKPNGAS